MNVFHLQKWVSQRVYVIFTAHYAYQAIGGIVFSFLLVCDQITIVQIHGAINRIDELALILVDYAQFQPYLTDT